MVAPVCLCVCVVGALSCINIFIHMDFKFNNKKLLYVSSCLPDRLNGIFSDIF